MDSREIDQLVAEKVMGWIKPPATSVLKPMWVAPPKGTVYPELPKFSTNIQDAWAVVEKLKEEKLFRLTQSLEGKWWADFNDEREYHESAPMAICLAALKAVEI
jgi:hypothetical protein